MSTYDMLLLATYPILPIELLHLVLIDGCIPLNIHGVAYVLPQSYKLLSPPTTMRKAPNHRDYKQWLMH